MMNPRSRLLGAYEPVLRDSPRSLESYFFHREVLHLKTKRISNVQRKGRRRAKWETKLCFKNGKRGGGRRKREWDKEDTQKGLIGKLVIRYDGVVPIFTVTIDV